MKNLLLIIGLVFTLCMQAQRESPEFLEAVLSQEELNAEFADAEETILIPEDFKNFKELEFYPIDLKYRVTAAFVRTPKETPFLMPTTTDRLPEYVKYGEAHFELDGKKLRLNLYQSVPPMTEPEYIDYLFLPFTDFTSGDGSYGGGRFIDARIPEGQIIIIDFNKAYNPYCAYNSNYSCPIPPRENDLLVRIEAGVKDFGKHN
ncbi:hypothetical protein ULMS_12590 [Patiriisocius marinistellae]|uniref:DUF1684 domain-containing protein n=1 Tax=Patiriisocius marinistellae TaxID=2494560 RepID=A0A5J4G165_9FLAO|nr:DUF1684 domain-containing protein [Patiriisocius marinistellae]GEQ85751.1 hypothetical protein ULMS_12590 [Patiriisocius marinistellae]